MYCVIMGDIINSRKRNIEEQLEDSVVLSKIFEDINCSYRSAIFSPLITVRGDAFEGVLFSPYYAFDILNKIIIDSYLQRGITFRVCAVVGDLDTLSFDSNYCNGPGFITALDELDKLKSNKSTHWHQMSFFIDAPSKPLVDGIMSLINGLTASWTSKQREIIWAMQKTGEQKLVSAQFGVTPTVISKQLKSANYKEYRYAIEQLKAYIEYTEKDSINNGSRDYISYYNVGRLYSRKYQYAEALEYYKKAYELSKDYNVFSYRLIPLYNGIVQSCIEMHGNDIDELKQADYLQIAQKVLDVSLSHLNERQIIDFDYIQTTILHGYMLQEMEDWMQSKQIFERAYKLTIQRYSQDNPLYDACCTGLATAFKHLNDFEDALKYYGLSLEYAKEYSIIDPLGYADSLYNLVSAQYESGSSIVDIDKLKEAIDIYRKHLNGENYALLEAVGLLDICSEIGGN